MTTTHTKNVTQSNNIQKQGYVELNRNLYPRGMKVTIEPNGMTTVFQIKERVTVSQWNLLETNQDDTGVDSLTLFEAFPFVVQQVNGNSCDPCCIPVIETLSAHNEREFKDCKGNSVILSDKKPRVTLSEVGLFYFKRSDFGGENVDLYFYWDDIEPKQCY